MVRWSSVAGCVLGGSLAVCCVPAQMHKVARPETVVRAVGVYEWTGDLAKPKGERLVPVTIFIDGQIQDAALYLARPVPLALGSGTVYELDDAGVEKGLVDVKEARHVQIPAAADATPYDDGWFGYGVFEAPRPPRVATKKATQQVAVNGKVPGDPDRPKFASNRSADHAEDKPEAGSPEDVKVDGGDGGKDDVDRPTLRRRAPVDPKEAKKARKERDLSSVTPEKGSLNDDPDRPRMKRNTAAAEDDMAALNGLPADMKQMVAVSDAKRRDPHPFARAWEDEAEHQAILAKLRAMAQTALVAYGPVPPGTPIQTDANAAGAAAKDASGATSSGLKAQDTSNGSAPVLRRNHVAANAPAQEQVTAPAATAPAAAARPAAPTRAGTRTTAAQRAAAKRLAAATPAPGTVLADEEVRGFNLSYGGAATYIYTAHTAGTGAALRYITVVAQEDGVNGLHEAMHTVTDATHLDRTPWMRFIDAVDVEASNRASLLFELRGQTSRQFGLYRVLGGKADPLFLGGTTQ